MNLKINKTHDENSNPCYNYEGENHTEITCNSNNNCVWIPKNDNDFNKYNNSIDNRCYSIIEIDFEKPNHVCGDSLGNIEDTTSRPINNDYHLCKSYQYTTINQCKKLLGQNKKNQCKTGDLAYNNTNVKYGNLNIDNPINFVSWAEWNMNDYCSQYLSESECPTNDCNWINGTCSSKTSVEWTFLLSSKN